MKKSSLIIVIILCVIYLLVYAIVLKFQLFSAAPQVLTVTNEPVLFLPLCEPDELSIGFIHTEKASICQTKTGSLVVRTVEKMSTVLDAKELTHQEVLGAYEDIVFLSAGNSVEVYQLTIGEKVTALGIIPLDKNETPLAIFVKGTEATYDLYLSTTVSAQSPNDRKSRIRKITIRPTETPTIQAREIYSSKKMEQVTFVSDQHLVYTQESYAFLAPFKNIIRWGNKPKAFSLTQPIDESIPGTPEPLVHTTNAKTWATIENNTLMQTNQVKDSAAILFHQGENLLQVTPAQSLVWITPEKQSVLLSEVETIPRLRSIGNTIIGKKVYNCIDFSESAQLIWSICLQS